MPQEQVVEHLADGCRLHHSQGTPLYFFVICLLKQRIQLVAEAGLIQLQRSLALL